MAKKTNGPRISFSDVLANSLFLRAPERIREVVAETEATRQADAARLMHGDEFVAGQVEDEAQRQAAYKALAVAMKGLAQRQAAYESLATAQRGATPGKRETLWDGKALSEILKKQAQTFRDVAAVFPKKAPTRRSVVADLVHSLRGESRLQNPGQPRWSIADVIVDQGSVGYPLALLPLKGERSGLVEPSNPDKPFEVFAMHGPVGEVAAVKSGFGRGDVQEAGQTKSGTWARALREAVEALAGAPGVEKIVVGEPAEPGGTRPIEVYFRDSNAARGPTVAK